MVFRIFCEVNEMSLAPVDEFGNARLAAFISVSPQTFIGSYPHCAESCKLSVGRIVHALT
jgi:hypothetical protein